MITRIVIADIATYPNEPSMMDGLTKYYISTVNHYYAV